jgi:type I restriction enzyme S subunit
LTVTQRRNWRTVVLGDHIDFLTGFPFKSARFTTPATGVRLLKGSAVAPGDVDWTNAVAWPNDDVDPYGKYSLQLGDVILAMDRPWLEAGLKFAWVRERDLPSLLVQRVARMRGTRGLETTFLRYVIGSKAFENYIAPMTTGVNVPHISPRQICSYEFEMPSLPNQRKIAVILAAYDDLIENNSRRIELLEEMAQRIYREWFVDFRYPGHEGVPLVDSELGPIPRGWSVARVGDVMEFVYGKALKADGRRGGEVAVFGSGGQVGRHDEALDAGPGVIVGRKGNVGSVYWSDGPFFAIDTTFWIRSNLSLSYCYFAIRDMEFIDSHAAVPGLSREQAYGLAIVVPRPGPLARFDDSFGPMWTLRSRLVASANALRAIRDLLLPRLISGEIDVESLDIAMPGVAA